MNRYAGKVALVTGASRGIGRGIALRLAQEGANVVVNYRTHLDEAEDVASAIEEMGQRALVWQTDVADRDAVAGMYAAAEEEFGHIDVAVANAALSIREPVIEAKWENVLRTIEVSQFGVFHTCQMAAQHMVKHGIQGNILVISSIHEEMPVPASAAYNMAKAAINHLARTMAAELVDYKINVNVINPGWIDTPGERQFATEEEIRAGAQLMPWKRLGTLDDIASAAAFLCSAEADYITGTMLRVDGGYMMGLGLPESTS